MSDSMDKGPSAQRQTAQLTSGTGTASSVQPMTDMCEFEDALRAPVVHFWPYDRAFRKSGAADPQIGDLASCGEMKTGVSAWGQKFIGAPLSCADCARRAKR